MTFKEFVQRIVSSNKMFFPTGFICNQITVPVAKAHDENYLKHVYDFFINAKGKKSKFSEKGVFKNRVVKTEVVKTEVLKTEVSVFIQNYGFGTQPLHRDNYVLFFTYKKKQCFMNTDLRMRIRTHPMYRNNCVLFFHIKK